MNNDGFRTRNFRELLYSLQRLNATRYKYISCVFITSYRMPLNYGVYVVSSIDIILRRHRRDFCVL